MSSLTDVVWSKREIKTREDQDRFRKELDAVHMYAYFKRKQGTRCLKDDLENFRFFSCSCNDCKGNK